MANKTEAVELDIVVKQINKSLSHAQGNLDGITLEEGSVTLETIAAQSGGGGFEIFVKAARKWEKETSNSVTYNFSQQLKLMQLPGLLQCKDAT